MQTFDMVLYRYRIGEERTNTLLEWPQAREVNA